MKSTNQELLNRKVNELLYHYEAEQYDRRHPETIEGDRLWWEEFGLKFISPSQAPLTILDVGTGTGLVPSALKKYIKPVFRFICYEISEGMLRQASKKLETHSFSFIKGDALFLPFADKSMDVVIFNSLLHHLFDYRKFLSECDRVLKADGILAFAHEPNKLFLQSRLPRALATLYNWVFPIDLTNELRDKVNAQLRQENIIQDNLSREEIRGLVEFHSPMEQSRLRVDSSKGFIPQQLIKDSLAGYSVIELCEYSTYFHRPLFQKVKMLALLLRLIQGPVFKRGNLFKAILKK